MSRLTINHTNSPPPAQPQHLNPPAPQIAPANLIVRGSLNGGQEAAAYIYITDERTNSLPHTITMSTDTTALLLGPVGQSHMPVAFIGCDEIEMISVEKAESHFNTGRRVNLTLKDSHLKLAPDSSITSIGDLSIDETSSLVIDPISGFTFAPIEFTVSLNNFGSWVSFLLNIDIHLAGVKMALSHKHNGDLDDFKHFAYNTEEEIDFSALRILSTNKSALKLLDTMPVDLSSTEVKTLVNGNALFFAGLCTTDTSSDFHDLDSALTGHISEFWGFDIDFSS